MVGARLADSPALNPSFLLIFLIFPENFSPPPLDDKKHRVGVKSLSPHSLFACNWIQTKNKFPQNTVYLPKEIIPIVISNYANPQSHSRHVAPVFKNWSILFELQRFMFMLSRGFPFLTQRKTLHSHKRVP